MAGAFDAKVDISTKEARDGLIALRKEAKLLGQGLQELDGIIKANKQNVILVAQQFTKLVAEQRRAAAGAKELAQADIAAARAAGIRNVAEAKVAESTARKGAQDAQAARSMAQAGVASARVTDIEARRTMATDRQAAATRRATQSQTQMHDSMSNSRYLMYDVGATYGVISAALLAIPAATAAVSAAYQKDFANVIRVNEEFQKTPEAAQAMKNSLKDIATEIPVAFGELSRITQLGAQMGVADSKLAAFTETTAKFVAVTGISSDTGATLFGRLETSFTEDVQKFPDFFERVGSAIAYVGAKTVATDPEIASMLNQIGPLGAAAGMSAAEVTGLSAALSSVRVQPELARGTLTRVFGQLNRDVAEGSPRMAEFGKILGITGEAAGNLWKNDSSKFFTDLMAGLQGVQQREGQLTTTLDKLGIKASRDVSALTKLAIGNDVLVTSMEAANKGFAEGTALNEMSKPVFETVAAKLTEMANAWKNLGDTLGSGALGPLAFFIEAVTNFAIGIDALVDKVPLIGVLIQVLMGIASVTALFLGFKAAQAFVMAGMIGFQQAASRGMGGGLALGSMMRTLAQTMLMAKGATDQQSRALLGQVGALRALAIASTANQASLARTATVTNNVDYATGRAARGIRGMGSSMLGLVGGPMGLMIGGLALLVGHLINTQIEAEQAGKNIAEAMAQGAEGGARAVAEAFNSRKVSATDGALGFSDIDKTFTQIAEKAGVSFGKAVDAISKGETGMKAFREELERVAKADGYKNLADALANPLPGTKAAELQFISRVVEDYAAKNTEAAKGLKKVADAAPLAGKGFADTGDEADAAALDVDKMTKSLKDLNDEVFGIINSEAAVQAALQNLGESIYKSKSFSTDNEDGRTNLKNFEDVADKSREHFAALLQQGTITAEQAAQGYAEFIQGLLNEIKAKGGDTSGIESLAMQSAERFQAAIGANPAKLTVEADTAAAAAKVESLKNSDSLKATLTVGMDPSNADANMMLLSQAIAKITGLPYNVVMDALTDPAHEKAQQVEDLLIQITSGTYTAAVDADTSAAIANVQNFVAFARTELAHLQTKMNGGIGLGDGEGSMSPVQKGQYAAIGAPKAVAVPRQVRVPSTVTPKTNLGQNLQGIGDGYRKAGDEAAKAGDKAKKAAKDIGDGIDDSVKSAEDYGNRLKTALMSAYNQQYGLTKATDDYHSALNAITKKREDEIKQVEDLRDKVRELNNERDKELISANKAKIEQGISIKYGEVDRAADYGNQAKTALDNAAAKQKDITATNAQAKELSDGIGALTGYSDAAIANREALRNLETKTFDMIAAYAAQGHSSEEVRRYAQQLTGQFQTDVGQMGFNMAAVGALQGSLERYIGVVDSVPQVKPTEVTADTTQATADITAFNDLLDGIDQGIVIPVDADTSGFEWHVADALARVQRNLQLTLADPTGTGSSIGGRENGSLLGGMYMGGQVQGFASGGQVPGKSPSNPRQDNMLAKVDGKGLIGIRSREWIMPEPAVDYYGPSMMQAIQTMKMPKFSMGGSPSGARGGSGSLTDSVVELGAATLAAMAEMRQDIKLFTENRVIAESANAGNKQLAAEGHN